MENYELYLSSDERKQLQPMTNTQVRFAKFLLENAKELSVIGDLESIFKNVRKFIKNNQIHNGTVRK